MYADVDSLASRDECWDKGPMCCCPSVVSARDGVSLGLSGSSEDGIHRMAQASDARTGAAPITVKPLYL